MESSILHALHTFIPSSIRVNHGIYLVTTIRTIVTKPRSVSQNYMFVEQFQIDWPLERRHPVAYNPLKDDLGHLRIPKIVASLWPS